MFSQHRLIFLVTRDFETIYDNWDDMNIMPTAIVALNDQEALKIMSFLQSRNREAPRDMSPERKMVRIVSRFSESKFT